MQPDIAPREFHISRRARQRYEFDLGLFSITGNVIFPNFHAARVFAQKMNQQRDLLRFPEQTVKAGDVNAMGLIDEILHFVVHLYRRQKNPQVMSAALAWLEEHLGRKAIDGALRVFTEEFPPLVVYRGEITLPDYLNGQTAGVPNRLIVLEEMLMLWLANVNPAFSPFAELFDDHRLRQETVYSEIATGLHDFFDTQPRFGPDNQNLIDLLRAPALASPDSLTGQLDFILKRWGTLVGERYLSRLLTGLDLIKEEQALRFMGAGPAQVPVYTFAGMEFEPERYSPDLDWMPRLTLIAKNIYVWMSQLSRNYQTSITRLDQIPDAELDLLARWGFTGLWLIGVWERSAASRRIKQRMGNPEAVASAYSVFDYAIAGDLGGEAAMQNLRERAWRRGIRMASDMVPNHMAIDSRWVIEHPDWFVGLDSSPFPSYSFNGPDLSGDARVGIFLEDHYYNRSDAAVVFKRLDRWTGSEKFIYHGNDGTSMPWNDTAQLDYIRAEVREAVIQTILHVARQFPVIRFDAAMTLAKKHFQRLWYPEPGTGGAIPSRAEHGMTKAEFDGWMPQEFWREVVDRMAAEAPDTLLLAEAFWLMEGYFVRTLGMHRVYNSAFMNMLRDEDNAKYRSVMKNTLEFDPEVLKRHVNFMNNPDERTAVDQFGKGDKYFGVCTMMATLPGLPMFGHGQVEGFAEKYGMEYQRAYWDEHPDLDLVRRHEREIFPLLRRRYLFAGVENFLLYDFFTPEGHVNEDVFAYSNRMSGERALVVYHNKYASARGWINASAAFSIKTGNGDERKIIQQRLGEGWALHNDANYFVIFRDQTGGLEYIRNSKSIWDQGLYVELNAYQYQVFMGVREVLDDEAHLYARLASNLNGRGVSSMDDMVRELALQPVLVPFRELVNPGVFRSFLNARVTDSHPELDAAFLDDSEQKMAVLLRAIAQYTQGAADVEPIVKESRSELELLLQLPQAAEPLASVRTTDGRPAAEYIRRAGDDPKVWSALFSWWAVHALGRVVSESEAEQRSRGWIDEWLLGRSIADTLRGMGLDEGSAAHAIAAIKLLTTHRGWFAEQSGATRRAYLYLESWLRDDEVLEFLQVNRYDGVLWFNKETFQELVWWMFALAVIEISERSRGTQARAAKEIAQAFAVVERLQKAEAESGYKVEMLLAVARRLDAPKARPRRSTQTNPRPRAKSGKESDA